MVYTREELTRRLLGAATQLFLDDKDPVSVHCLASSAAEHASHLSKSHTGRVFNDHILATFPERDLKDIRRIRNRIWTAIKHSHDQKGNPIDLRAELEGFGDEVNDHVLFVVWSDFSNSGQPLPIEAQVFQVWYLELYPEKLDPRVAREGKTTVFRDIGNLDRVEQKECLRDAIQRYATDPELLDDPKTDRRPLVLT